MALYKFCIIIIILTPGRYDPECRYVPLHKVTNQRVKGT